MILLHGAVHVGQKLAPGKILFCTFSRSLAQYLFGLFHEIPNCPDNVEFKTAHQVAWRLSTNDNWIDNKEVDAAFEQAYEEVIPGTSLANTNPEYLREEIRRVIKGRNASREEYLDTDRFQRIGHRVPFRRREREICWQLHDTWNRKMSEAGTRDWDDIILEARKRAAAIEDPTYSAVIVDEART